MDRQYIIEAVNLSKTFSVQGKSGGTETHVLQNINIGIRRGEIFGIIGKSGAGKSTLARCFNLLERPTSGEIYFDGRDITKLSGRDLYETRRHMGMIFQQFNLLMQRTALDNVCFPLEIAGVPKKEARKRAAELLDLVGLSDKAASYPA
jgi:D-methionine transport system ATP-binding protein